MINFLLANVQGNAFPDRGNTKLSKTLTESFKTNTSPEITIRNKYGNITFEHWAKDSVRFEVEITAYGRTENIAEDLDRVEIDFSDRIEAVKAETELDNNTNPISSFFNQLLDYPKAVFSENNLKIHYKVYAPKNSKLNISNKFGDFYAPQIAEKSSISVAYGNLKTEQIGKDAMIEIRFGSGNIGTFEEGMLRSKISEIEIDKGNKLELESHSSTLEIENINHLVVKYRNDKIYIQDIQKLEGTGYFSRFEIEEMTDEVNTELTYGKFEVEHIPSTFSKVKINSKATDIELEFDEKAQYALQTEGKKGNVNLPKSLLALEAQSVPNGRNIKISGKIGAQDPASEVIVRANGGEVTTK